MRVGDNVVHRYLVAGSEDTICGMLDRPIVVEHHTMHPIVRRIILEQFLAARKATAERVKEQWFNRMTLGSTVMSYDSDGNVLCEDVFVEQAVEW